jgi:integrase
MSVYDRWHKTRPGPGDEPCREHSRGRTELYPTADHGKGDRWQVRYRDDHGRQRKQSFDKRPAADTFDAKIRTQLAAGTFVDPAAGQVTFREYAEEWRKGRTHDIVTAQHIEAAFRLRVYPVIGDHPMRLLAQRPSIVQAWISGVQMHPNSVRQVIKGVSQVFTAAIEDGIIPRNPLAARSVQKPKRLVSEVTPWSARQVEAMASQLPARLAAIPYLGAACGLRQGELFGLAADDLDFLCRAVHVEVQLNMSVRASSCSRR